MQPYFIFKDIDSTSLLTVEKLPPIIMPDANIEKIIIPGKNGFLTQDDESYQGIIKSVECFIKDLSQIDYICSWLKGSGEVIFSNQPDRVFKATIINKIEFSRVMQTFHRFLIQFDCQPHSYDLSNELITLEEPNTILNFTNAPSEPVVKLYGNGDITFTINGANIYLYNVIDYVTIDSVLMDAYKDTVLKNNDMSGDFPIFIPGENSISWSGNVTKLQITPNWRWI